MRNFKKSILSTRKEDLQKGMKQGIIIIIRKVMTAVRFTAEETLYREEL